MTTIFAPINSITGSCVSTIRISGEKSLLLAKKLGLKSIKANEIKFVKIKDVQNDILIDEALISYFQAPNSFTGQDIIEISIHSSNFIYKKISEILLREKDVRIAQAGEFSQLAFLNNKLDLVQAEAIIDLIKSETELQHQQALKQLSGEGGKKYKNWRNKIIEILALIESFIDFPDEDLPQEIIDLANEKIQNLKSEISINLKNDKGQKIKDGINLSIIGAPNVGKSTLLNYLAQSDVAIVSEIEGTTRDIININLDISGVAVKISDTAGIRQTNDLIEKEGIKRAFKNAHNSDLIIFIDDGSNQIDFLKEFKNNKIIKVLNKIDLDNNSHKSDQFDVAISLKKNVNLDSLFEKISQNIKELIPQNSEFFITQERYKSALKSALFSLEEFDLENNIEIAAENLRIAASEIAKITGEISVDDILDVIFSKFCIGK